VFTIEEVAGCQLCSDLAGTAIASKIIEIQGVSREEMLTNIAAIHFHDQHPMGSHITRLDKLSQLENR
jgi:hypothetical protein